MTEDDDGMRSAAKGTPWNETYDTINSVIDKFVNDINSTPNKVNKDQN